MRKLSFTLFVIFSCLFFSCNNNSTTVTTTDSTTVNTDTAGAKNDSVSQLVKNYTNSNFNISAQLPANWKAFEAEAIPGTQVINFLSEDRSLPSGKPYIVHADADISFISVLPKGYGTELPSGEMKNFSEIKPGLQLSFKVNEEASKVLLLKDSTPWAYFIIPANPPKSWSNYGFIFAQIKTNNLKITCFDVKTGKEIPEAQCDPLGGGNKIVREGNIEETEATTIKKILSSIQIENKPQPLSDLIKVESPQPNSKVESPLTVKGKARGYWFFEAEFSVKLYDENNKLLTRGNAMAKGEWMTEDFVDFSVTLKFTPPKTGKGKLVFEKANPSGLAENERSFSMPVSF